MGGFQLVNHWIHRFTEAKFGKGTTIPNLSAKAKKVFNAKVMHIKQMHKYETKDMMNLIDFMYLHNPLLLWPITQYGNVHALEQSASYFDRWRKQNETLINREGEAKAIEMTAPVPMIPTVADVPNQELV